MKTKILVLLLAFSWSVLGQREISLSINQDLKFLTIGDKKRGYDPLTANFNIRLKMKGHQLKNGYMIVFPEFWYANIEGLFKKYSFNVGYSFNQWDILDLGFTQISIKNFEFTIGAGYGFIERFGRTSMSGNAFGEITYKITPNLNITANTIITDRTDLLNLYNEKNRIRLSGFIGIEINIIKLK